MDASAAVGGAAAPLGVGAAGAPSPHADEVSAAAPQAEPLLLDLPDEALIAVLGHLYDPVPLASSCKHLAGLLRSPALHVAWLLRHGAAAAPRRPPAGRLLTFRPLRGAAPAGLAALLLRLVEARGDPRDAEAAAAARGAQRRGELGHVDVLRLAAAAALRARHAGLATRLLQLLAGGGGSGGVEPAAAAAALQGPGGGVGGHEGGAAAARLPPGFDELAAHCGCDGGAVAGLYRMTHPVGVTPPGGEPGDDGGGFLLPGAAGSGRLGTVRAAAAALGGGRAATRQLPAALCLAGRAGHVAVVEELLAHPQISSRPLEIAAHDAGARGWPAAALAPVASAVAGRYREDAARMLAGAVERAVGGGRPEVAAVLWDAMVQGRPEPERFTDLILRLAAAGDYGRALWVADASPPVMVKVGTAPAAAAAERGHARLATLLAERAGRAPPAGRAAAARGRLAAAVAAGDVGAAAALLLEVTLGPGELRGELLCRAAAAGNLEMLLLLFDRLGPWMGEEVPAIAALAAGGREARVAALHAAAPPPLRPLLLRACCKLCGAWRAPGAGLMAWALRESSNPAALDLMMADYAHAWRADSSTSYLGGVVGPHPDVSLALSPVAPVWAEVFAALSAPTISGSGGGGGSGSGVAPGPLPPRGAASDAAGSGGAAAAAARVARGSDGGARARGRWRPRGVAPGAARFTARMMRLVLETGSVDLLYQALAFLETHEADLEESGEQPRQQASASPDTVAFSSTDDFMSRVEIYRGRHSVVWSAAKMTERNFHQVRREIRLMRQVACGGSVRLHGAFEDDDAIYLVQEICAKGDLFKTMIRSGGTLDERYVAAAVTAPLLATLAELHAGGVLHRDIKPENIFFMRDGSMRLGDFGLAIDAAAERPKSRVGTLDYMAPEVVSLPTAEERRALEQQGRPAAPQVYDEKVDVWAVGILAYELLVGRPPFEVDDESETRAAIMHAPPPRLPPHVSGGAADFIAAALSKAPAARPAAAELLRHPWLRPHLAAAAAAAGGAAAAAAAGGAARAAAVCGGPAPAAPGARPRPAPLVLPGGLDAGAHSFPCAIAGGGGAGARAGGAPPGSLAGRDAPATPGPYGPPGGGGRKPVWDGRGKLGAAPGALQPAAAGGGAPLLKAALNAGLQKLSLRPAAAAAAGPQQQAARPAGASGGAAAAVKARLRNYFVARACPEASNGGGTLT
ncbi:MAG: hypothetical protein J3K34DRAFT_526873 [Monoraphidium minutum]|nr:MAG: hypothetical protein J3K34DRAFT_526873 [Monoraphidium minutum]